MEKLREWFYYYQKKILVFGGLFFISFFVLCCGVFYYIQLDHSKEEVKVSDDLDLIKLETENDDSELNKGGSELYEEVKVKVDIKGAVVSPGVIEVSNDSRVADVIMNAGGLLDYADVSVLNLSKKVFDEMVIVVYTKDEVNNFIKVKEEEKIKQESCVIVEEKIINNACVCDNEVNDVGTNGSSDGNSHIDNLTMISLNKATLDELMTLSGIGESKAQAIINYRDQNGGFKTIDELKEVKGIGDSLFENIKDRITV